MLLCLLASVSACESDDAPQEPVDEEITVSPYFNERLFICHRGLTDYPENTFVAIDVAADAGFKAVECDICMTKDGVFVLQHDATIDRCSDGTGRVNDMTYQELLNYDFGSWKGEQFKGERIVRLDDLLEYFKAKQLIIELDLADNTRFNMAWFPALYKLVEQKHMLGQTIFTATQDQLEPFLHQPVPMIVSVSAITNLYSARRALTLKDKVTLCILSVYKGYLRDDICQFAHENGIKVKTWTILTQQEMDDCLDKGADYAITEILP